MSAQTIVWLGSAALALCGPTFGALAQVTLDGTANPNFEGPLEGPDYQIPAEFGRRAGANLFHSFEKFDLRTLDDGTIESATFSGPDAIRNVISRVTGGDPSDINGVIRSTIEGADFFFLNPAGVVFGPNASLEVPGSFHVSTADELRFEGGERFSARLGAESSFALAPPEAFGFLGGRPEKITVRGSALVVEGPGEALSLVAGDVELQGGTVLANSVLVAAQQANGSVPVQPEGAPVARDGPVTLMPGEGVGASVVSTGPRGGSIRIEGGEIMLDRSRLFDINAGDLDSQDGIALGARRLTVVGEGSNAGAQTVGNGRGRAGPITVVAPDVRLAGGTIASSGIESGSAPAGDITIRGGRVALESAATILAAVPPEAGPAINCGTIKVTADEALLLRDGSVISTNTAGAGEGGAVVIEAGRLEILADGSITAATRGGGGTGSLDVEAGEIVVDHGFITAGPDEGSTGRAGEIDLSADHIVLRNEGFVGASPLGTSDTGNIIIKARQAIEITSDAAIAAQTTSSGRGGTIAIRTPRLLLDDGRVNVSTLGSRPAGSITVQADEVDIITEGRIISSTRAEGAAGSITMRTGELTIDGAGAEGFTGIASGSSGDGQGGAILVRADRIVLNGEASISTETGFAGGGDIRIEGRDLVLLRDGSRIGVDVIEGGARAGDITIDPTFLVLDESVIGATADAGSGGRIEIVADHLILSPGSEITARAGPAGIEGTVVVSSPEVDISSRLVILDAALLDAASLLREQCTARRDVGASSFTTVDSGGLPPSPDRPLFSNYVPEVRSAARSAADTDERKATPRVALVMPCRGPG